MFTGRVSVTGLDRIGRKCKRRTMRLQDLRWLSKEFEEYLRGSRNENLWRTPGGVIRGPYGKGTEAWERNAPATIEKKGFNKPLYSTRQRHGSKILRDGYKFRAWYQRRLAGTIAKFSFWAEAFRGSVNYAAVNDQGNEHIPARKHQGFFQGDAKWLAERAAKGALHVGER